MRKYLMFLFALMMILAFSGCNGSEETTQDISNGTLMDTCEGSSNFIVVNGTCIVLDEILSDRIHIEEDGSATIYNTSVELMDEFVADLTGSVGLAVIPRDTYEDATRRTARYLPQDLATLSALSETEDTENIIVKLTEEGFFEAVDFTTASGESVDITANPLALEVFGDFTVVIFEVNSNYYDENTQFSTKLYDSLYSGGIYLIHNESGKMFATKTVELIENTYTVDENHSRTVMVDVTLGESVYETKLVMRVDEYGNPVLDGLGNVIYDEVQEQLFDAEGNPLIFNEGPVLTEIQSVPKVEYYTVPMVDEDGNPVIDSVTGDQAFEIVEVQITDDDGNPIYEDREVPVTDEYGNPVYQTEFQMELFIEDIEHITYTEYYGNVTDNPLSEIAVKFVDQIMSKYYNWNYYRVQNYMISSWGFAMGEGTMFFMEQKQGTTQMENYVIKMYFDDETNELVLEEYLNATKAGFVNSDIILDPNTGNIINRPWDETRNLQVYSPVYGLKTVSGSDHLHPITFPNGDLYFYSYGTEYVEELGYYTALLYTVDVNGILQSGYIELGEYNQVCYGACVNSFSATMLDEEGNVFVGNTGWVAINMSDGDPTIQSAELKLISIDPYDSSRQECDQEDCYYQVDYVILDEDDDVFAEVESYQVVSNVGDVPPYSATYQMDASTDIEYYYVPTSENRVCTNTVMGCSDTFNLVDYSINQYGIWLYSSQIIAYGDTYLSTFTVNEENNAVYEYTKELEAGICEYDTCTSWIPITIYDLNGDIFSQSTVSVDFVRDDAFPLSIEFRMTDDTLLEEGETCTYTDGCWQGYTTDEGYYYMVHYSLGDVIYTNIDFAETDVTPILSQTLVSDYCTEAWGCSLGTETIYVITDPEGNVLFELSAYLGAEYGYRIPYKVTLVYSEEGASDVTLTYEQEMSSEIFTAPYDNYAYWVNIRIETSTPAIYKELGSVRMTFNTGEQVIQSIVFPQGTLPISTEYNNTCGYSSGCTVYTSDFTIFDEDGNILDLDDTYYYQSIPVFFAEGEYVPTEVFHVDLLLQNVEYYTNHIDPWMFLNQLNSVIILDENLYLVENTSYSQIDYNVILGYDVATGHYFTAFTDLTALIELEISGDSIIAINDEQTAIYKYTYNAEESSKDFYHYDEVNLTEGLAINAVNDLIVDYDGTIYFKGVDNFIQDITGMILTDGTVTLDTEYVEHEVIRVSPIN